MSAPLPLQDVHPGVAPGWWPPAPGWWMLAALLLVVAVVLVGWWMRRSRHRVALLRLFDEAVNRAPTPSQQVAAMSELLRRAARHRSAEADRLEGDAWLRFLDDASPDRPFSSGAGALLRDGGFRSDVSAADADALRAVARQRYEQWMRRA